MACWAICKGKFLFARTFRGYLCNRRGQRQHELWCQLPRYLKYCFTECLTFGANIFSKFSNRMLIRMTCVCIFMAECRTGDCDLSLAQYLSCMGFFLLLLGMEMTTICVEKSHIYPYLESKQRPRHVMGVILNPLWAMK